MKVMLVLAVVVVASYGMTLPGDKLCVPDTYQQGFLVEIAYGGSQPGIGRYNVTYYADFKKKVSYINTEDTMMQYNYYTQNATYTVYKTESGDRCVKGPLTPQPLMQCLPDDTKVIAEYTNTAGRKVVVRDFKLGPLDVTSVTEDNMFTLQTIKGATEQGVPFYNTQLYTTMSSKFSPDVFDLPSVCQRVKFVV